MTLKITSFPKDLPILNQHLASIDTTTSQIKDLQDSVTALKSLPILTGKGSPINVIPAPVGTLYLRLDGGTSTTLYVKETGGDAKSGWVAK